MITHKPRPNFFRHLLIFTAFDPEWPNLAQ